MDGHNASPGLRMLYPPDGLGPAQWEELNRLVADAGEMMKLAGDTSDGGHNAFRAALFVFRLYATNLASKYELQHVDRMADRAAHEAVREAAS